MHCLNFLEKNFLENFFRFKYLIHFFSKYINSLYTFDMRNLSHPRRVHTGHTNAVIDVDYSPTGTEFVSGSYDRSLRIFPVESHASRYHSLYLFIFL